MRKVLLALAVAAAMPAAHAQSVKIGVVTFLSGPAAAPFGVPAKNAAEFVVEQLNSGKAPAPYSKKGFGGEALEMVLLDEAGAVTICGRIKEIINAGGLTIYPAEIEEVLKSHAAVVDCGVFAEHADGLEYPCAAVVLRAPSRSAAEGQVLDELLRHCRDHLSPKMIPRRFVWVDRIPRGGLGKIVRSELRELCAKKT